MINIIILNPIGSYKVNFNGTIFLRRPILDLKISLMLWSHESKLEEFYLLTKGGTQYW